MIVATTAQHVLLLVVNKMVHWVSGTYLNDVLQARMAAPDTLARDNGSIPVGVNEQGIASKRLPSSLGLIAGVHRDYAGSPDVVD